MRNVVLMIALLALFPASLAAAAEPPRSQKSGGSISAKALPPKGARTDHTCAVYGAGFVRVEGTQTCVKIGGAISIGVGGSR